ncbi:hypothetical protein E2C01_028350 [Portunus trituberculatus]|uniref:Uncharacterized protein n=1 Tax=Portunus trituberculatus TaxID=210409 RepID=A0A5B7ENX3_PORTR|nr:hypothetical protein [Portunus trituberculatus]
MTAFTRFSHTGSASSSFWNTKHTPLQVHQNKRTLPYIGPDSPNYLAHDTAITPDNHLTLNIGIEIQTCWDGLVVTEMD